MLNLPIVLLKVVFNCVVSRLSTCHSLNYLVKPHMVLCLADYAMWLFYLLYHSGLLTSGGHVNFYRLWELGQIQKTEWYYRTTVMGFKVSGNTAGVNSINTMAMMWLPIKRVIAVTLATWSHCLLMALIVRPGMVTVVSQSLSQLDNTAISCLVVSAHCLVPWTAMTVSVLWLTASNAVTALHETVDRASMMQCWTMTQYRTLAHQQSQTSSQYTLWSWTRCEFAIMVLWPGNHAVMDNNTCGNREGTGQYAKKGAGMRRGRGIKTDVRAVTGTKVSPRVILYYLLHIM